MQRSLGKQIQLWHRQAERECVFSPYDNILYSQNRLNLFVLVPKVYVISFFQADKDGDGVITFDEFVIVSKKFPNILVRNNFAFFFLRIFLILFN